jgi:hypothetical protein
MALFGKTPEKKIEPDASSGIELGWSYSCQFCELTARSAKYLPDVQALIYECPDGHRSIIREFGLDIV